MAEIRARESVEPEAADSTTQPPAQQIHATAASPDFAEESFATPDADSSGIPVYHDQPVVGLGGSAGCLSALQAFFSQMPGETGLAFVVVLHLAPEYESTLAEILQRSTSMPVLQVRERLRVKPNHVYVIPPGKHLTATNGHLALSELERARGKRVAVDLFFRTLADTHGPNSVAIILSGAGSDGAIGIKRIKERGGLTLAQDLQESEHASMPRSAIETGMVDWILRAAEMPSRIVEYCRVGSGFRFVDGFENRARRGAAAVPNEETTLRDILALLRARTSRDFSGYKRGTLLRRIARRMQINGVEHLPDYHALLRTRSGETVALLQDLLISVTNFFRDRDAFLALELAIPHLFDGKGPADTVRVWTPGCATGEEAYSIAMLLCENASRLVSPPALQVFATDIDEQAVAKARSALYPATIVADVSDDRLRRFFVRQQNHFRVCQDVRERVLFAIHDVLRDAPFSQLDLVSCRNLLIYLNRESQRRCFDLFHFALQRDGLLFLGASETAEEAGAVFTSMDKKHRLYRRRPASRSGLPVPRPHPTSLVLPTQPRVIETIAPVSDAHATAPSITDLTPTFPRKDVSNAELHLKLIEQFAPPSMVVDPDGQIVHLSAKAGRFLQFTGGEPTMNVLQLVHPMLRIELRAGLFRAKESNGHVDIPGVPLEFADGVRRIIDLSVRSAPDLAPDLYLIVLNERESASASLESVRQVAGPEDVVRSLERELELIKQQLRDSVEQHGATTEEMKASNEELQAMNEELRSAAEELETSREELQSINEELATVNLELKGKVDELGRANGDLQNLMAATHIATLFVDRELRIKRYTPSAVAVFHLIPGDIGRPLADLRHRLEFDTVVSDATRVLATSAPHEREMRAANGQWFLTRIMPYRTSSDHVLGVVLTFVDITDRKRAEDDVRRSEARFRAIVEQTGAGICLTDPKGCLIFVNPRMSAMLGFEAAELLGKSFVELTFPGDLDGSAEAFARLESNRLPLQLEQRLNRRDGTALWVNVSISGIWEANGQISSCVAVVLDVGARKRAEESLQLAKNELEERVRARTTELHVSNQTLRAEMGERQRAETAREDMMRSLVNAQELERGRISRELHDEVGQQITALLLGLKSLEKELKALPNAIDLARSLHGIAESISKEVHEVALELRPTALDEFGLVRALATYLEEWSSRTRINVQFDHASLRLDRLPPQLESTFYRVICEALHNALKHAEAKNVSVILQQKPGVILAIVEDDGIGFDPAELTTLAKRRRLGLIGMRERVALVRGELTLETTPGRGTSVIIRVPFHA